MVRLDPGQNFLQFIDAGMRVLMATVKLPALEAFRNKTEIQGLGMRTADRKPLLHQGEHLKYILCSSSH